MAPCYVPPMRFMPYIKAGSKPYLLGRAANKSIVRLDGFEFHWNGQKHLYIASLIDDIPAGMLSHPTIGFAALGAVRAERKVPERVPPPAEVTPEPVNETEVEEPQAPKPKRGRPPKVS